MSCQLNYPKEAPLSCITSLIVLVRTRDFSGSIKELCAAIYAIIGYVLYVTVGEPEYIGSRSPHDLLDVEEFSDAEVAAATAAPRLDPEVRSKLVDLRSEIRQYLDSDDAKTVNAVGALPGFDVASFVRGLLALLHKYLGGLLL